jgi:hypothetical protein
MLQFYINVKKNIVRLLYIVRVDEPEPGFHRNMVLITM